MAEAKTLKKAKLFISFQSKDSYLFDFNDFDVLIFLWLYLFYVVYFILLTLLINHRYLSEVGTNLKSTTDSINDQKSITGIFKHSLDISAFWKKKFLSNMAFTEIICKHRSWQFPCKLSRHIWPYWRWQLTQCFECVDR